MEMTINIWKGDIVVSHKSDPPFTGFVLSLRTPPSGPIIVRVKVLMVLTPEGEMPVLDGVPPVDIPLPMLERDHELQTELVEAKRRLLGLGNYAGEA